MDFGLSDDQRALQDSVGRAAASLCPMARLRAEAAPDIGFPADLWQGALDLGLPGLMVPAEHGGLGLGLLDAALVAEMLGRHAVPLPFLAPIVMALLALRLAGSAAQRERFLPAIAEGRLRVAVGIAEFAAGARGDAGVSAQDSRLTGRALFLLDPLEADWFLLADREGALHLVARDAPGTRMTPLVTNDVTRRTAMLELQDTPAERLAVGDAAATRRVVDAGRVVLAADMLGAAWKMLDQAVEYAKTRHQFGRPIGSFQAIKHICAEMAAELEPGRALVWYAAHAFDEGFPDAPLACLHAKAYLADAARQVARMSTEVQGGIGITDELGLHYWFKRIGWSYQALGGPERLREEAAAAQDLAS